MSAVQWECELDTPIEDTNHGASIGIPLIAAVKAVLAERTKSSDWARVRPPLDPLSPAQRKELVAELSTLDAGAPA